MFEDILMNLDYIWDIVLSLKHPADHNKLAWQNKNIWVLTVDARQSDAALMTTAVKTTFNHTQIKGKTG